MTLSDNIVIPWLKKNIKAITESYLLPNGKMVVVCNGITCCINDHSLLNK